MKAVGFCGILLCEEKWKCMLITNTTMRIRRNISRAKLMHATILFQFAICTCTREGKEEMKGNT